MIDEDKRKYYEQLHSLDDKKSKLYYMLNGKKDAYCYLVNEKLYVIGVDDYLHWPVIKECDNRSIELYKQLKKSLMDVEENYSTERHSIFLRCYNKLNLYNRYILSQYDSYLLDLILRLSEQEVEGIIRQVESYQIMYRFYVFNRGLL